MQGQDHMADYWAAMGHILQLSSCSQGTPDSWHSFSPTPHFVVIKTFYNIQNKISNNIIK